MHALNPSKIRAAAHRAMALAALHANSSLATRLSRYNACQTALKSFQVTASKSFQLLKLFSRPFSVV